MPCVWLKRSLPQVSHPWPPRNSGKVNFVATRMPNRAENTKVSSDVKTWARIRPYSTDGSVPKLWEFRRSLAWEAISPHFVISLHLLPLSCLHTHSSQSNSH